MKPILLIVAGANGGGKTTLINRHKNLLSNTLFINPDDIAKKLDSSYDEKIVLEVGGKSKDSKQIVGLSDAYLVMDNIESEYDNVIPLWLFGFLY